MDKDLHLQPSLTADAADLLQGNLPGRHNAAAAQLSQELGSTEAVDAFLCSNDLLLNPSELLDELAEVDAAAAPAAGAESPATPGSGLVRLVSGS